MPKPSAAVVWISRGAALNKLGRYAESLISCDKGIELDPKTAMAWIIKGDALKELTRYKDAIAAYDRAIQLDPKNESALAGKNELLTKIQSKQQQTGETEESRTLIQHSKKTESSGVIPSPIKTELQAHDEPPLERTIKEPVNPLDTNAWNRRGLELHELGRYAEAVASFDKAIDIDPKFAEAVTNRGATLNKLGRYAEALASCEKAIHIKPDFANPWSHRGAALNKLGRHAEAVDSCDKAIHIKRDYANAWSNRGIALRELGQHAEAVDSFEKAIHIKPDYADAWFFRGVALRELGRHAESLVSCDKAIELDPKFAPAWNYKGDALKELEQYEEAIAAYDRAIQLDPKNESALTRKNELLAKIQSGPQQNGEKEERKTVIQHSKKTESSWVLPSPIKIDLQAHDDPTLERTIKEPELLCASEKPELTISFDHTQLSAERSHKVGITLMNTGLADYENVVFAFSSEFETKGIKPISLKAGESSLTDISITPKNVGNILLEITLTCKDTKGTGYKMVQEFWIDVVEKGATTSPPYETHSSPVSQFTPKTLTPKQIPPELSDLYTEPEFIGEGGFARVFKAKRRGDGKYVAVKVPISLDASTGKSFMAEMQNWAKLEHPNIVRLYDCNIMPMPYFEEELCDNALADQNKPIESEEAAGILFNICEGLKFAHAQKIIHRDLKPQNILLKNGVPKISDWGLSRIISKTTTTTATSYTIDYAAPEQIAKRAKDERTDIWQLGVIFYELVTGALPFTGDSMVEIVSSIATENPQQPSAINPSSHDVEVMIMKCLEKNPGKRYQSVFELQKDLAHYLRITYTESFKRSVTANDQKRSAFYCGDLVLVILKTGDLKSAYMYLRDLVDYSKGDVKAEAQELSEQIKTRMEEGMTEIPDELIQKAEIIVHQVCLGFGNRG